MKKRMYKLSAVIAILVLCGCSNNLYFGTNNSVCLNVSGTSKIHNNVSFAFNRAEIAVIPNDQIEISIQFLPLWIVNGLG